MRYFLVSLLGCLLAISTANSAPLRNYFGVGLRGQAIRLTPQTTNHNGGDVAGPTMSRFADGLGLQLESGFVAGLWSAYLGYCYDYNWEHEDDLRLWYTDSYMPHTSGHRSLESWHSNRFILGGRLGNAIYSGINVQPVLGAGLTFGWLRRNMDYTSIYVAGDIPKERTTHESQTSAGTFGWTAQAGFAIRHSPSFIVNLLLTLDNYNLSFPEDRELLLDPVSDVYKIALQVGIQYLPH